MIGALAMGLLDLLLPRHCVVSGRPLAHDEPGCVAPEVLRQAKLTAGDYCSRCGARQGEGIGAIHGCGRCEEFKEGFGTREVCAVGDYEGVLQSLCLALKFGGERAAAAPLSHYLIQLVFDRGLADKVDAVVPVPLHPLRQYQRGYNQAELLARPLARALSKPLWNDVLRRRRRTKAQSELSAAQRRSNVEDAFEVRPRRAARVEGRSLLVVDDVMTTGATLAACAKALKRAGAKAVLGAVIARSTVGADT
ncbi:ComF family protein [bacterium]|nr:MAG: ComF family protein [bacterium]